MKSFLELQNSFIKNIKDNYILYLGKYNIKQPEIITEFLDLDKYKNDFCMFVEFNKIEFPESKYDDDCEKSIRQHISVYLVFRNDSVHNIRENMQNATYAFYEMLCNTNIKINGIDYYHYVEGQKYIVASQISIIV